MKQQQALDTIPNRRTRTHTERITLAVDPSLKRRFDSLKGYGKDGGEWLRDILKRELDKAGV